MHPGGGAGVLAPGHARGPRGDAGGEDVLGDSGRRRRERRAGGENLPQAQSAARTARRLRAAAREVAFKTNLY